MKKVLYTWGHSVRYAVVLLITASVCSSSDGEFERFRRQDAEAWQHFLDGQKTTCPVHAESPRPEEPQSEARADESVSGDDSGVDDTPAVEAVLPTLPTITSWLPPPAVTNIEKYAIPENPCEGLTLRREDEPNLPDTPQELLGTPLAQNINTLTRSRYRAVVTAAHETMRMILGQMSPERSEVFECRWMALYDFPAAKVINYLDRLNPLLVEFLALANTSEVMLMDLADLQYEAEMAAAYEAEAEARSAMEQIVRTGAMLKTIKGRLDGVAKAIEALGDPPDPREEKCRARRKFKTYCEPPEGGAWVLQSNKVESTWFLDDYRIATNKIDLYDDGAVAHSIVPAKFLDADENVPDFIIRWKYDWVPPAEVFRPNEDPRGLCCRIADAGVTYGDERVNATIWMLSTNHVSDIVYFDGKLCSWSEEKHLNGVYHSLLMAQQPPRVGGFKRLTPQQEKEAANPTIGGPNVPELKFVPEGRTRERAYGQLLEGEHGWTMVIEIRFSTAYSAGKASYFYMYDAAEERPPAAPPWPPLNPQPAPTPAADTPPPEAPTTPVQPTPPTDEELAAEALLKEKVAFHENQIALLGDDIRRYQEMLAKVEPDNVDSKTALTYSIMTKQADLQSQYDQIATLKTGNFVRTRTAFDELLVMQSQANSRKMATTIKENLHRSGTIDRLTKLLPPEEQYSMRQWVRRQLGDGDPDPATMRKVAAVIAEKASAHNQADIAQYDELEAQQQYAIDVLDNYQTAGRYTMYMTPFVAGGPALAFAYGITSGGIDGYQTGGMLGPDHKGAVGAAVGGVVTAARYLSSSIDYGLTFYEGYSYPDESGEQGGVLGGLKRVAVTFIERKAMQTVTQGIQGVQKQVALRHQARQQAIDRQAKLNAWRNQQKIEFRQRRKVGEGRVKRHQRLYREFKEARDNGSPPEVVAAAKQRLLDQTAAVMHSPHAKGYLKFNATPAEQRAYNATSRLHINRVVKQYRAELQRQGYDTDALTFKTMRNAGSTSPGMDTDIAVKSRYGNVIRRIDPVTGKTVDMDLYRANQSLQSVFNTVYRENSGQRGAPESWINITTDDHLESYRDKNWLETGKRARLGLNPKAGIDPLHAADAARVTSHKIDEMNQNQRPRDDIYWEQARGTAKDIDTKVIPLVNQRINETKNPKRRAQLQDRVNFYKKLRDALNLANQDPVASEEAVRQLTGFHPVESMKMSTIAIEGLGKW